MRFSFIIPYASTFIILTCLILQARSQFKITKQKQKPLVVNSENDLNKKYKFVQNSFEQEQVLAFKRQISPFSLNHALSFEDVNHLEDHNQRKLQQKIQTNNRFIVIATWIFQIVFPIFRNLILIGIVTNSMDLFLPYLILSESFLMLGFWVCQKHYLSNLFANVFSSYLDILNAMRLLVQPNNEVPNLHQLSQYGLSSFAIINLSGQFFIALMLLLFTILSKITILCTKYESLRRVANNLRPIWNSYFFAIFPRVATFTGLHWRAFGANSRLDAFNAVTCSLLSIIIVAYFIIIMVQTKKISLQKHNVQNREQLGLLKRIDCQKQFKFDLLQFSSIYYPSMNYLRLLIYFIPIGLIWNCKQISYGGPFFSQFLMIMVEVSSSGYLGLRNKIIFPLLNFLLILVQLCIIIIGLAQSIPYSEISQTYETLLFTLLFIIFTTSLFLTSLDVWPEITKRCNNKISQSIEQNHKKENDTTQTFGHHLHTRKCQGSLDEAQQEQVKSHRLERQERKGQKSFTKLKLKKVRQETPHKCNFIFQ